jgi:hypothetical protein
MQKSLELWFRTLVIERVDGLSVEECTFCILAWGIQLMLW